MSPTQPDGYLALPASGKGSPVLVLHAWWGLNDTIKTLCKLLAESGFVAFAPDLYQGKVADTIDGAKTLSAGLSKNPDHATNALENALTFLREQGEAETAGITVIGFSLGAYYALDLSNTHPETIQSVVVFYGTGPTDFSQAQADYLGHFAVMDEFEPQESVDELEEALKGAGRPVTFYRYDDMGHWFFEPDRVDAYNPAASSLAWERTLAFLKRSASL